MEFKYPNFLESQNISNIVFIMKLFTENTFFQRSYNNIYLLWIHNIFTYVLKSKIE